VTCDVDGRAKVSWRNQTGHEGTSDETKDLKIRSFGGFANFRRLSERFKCMIYFFSKSCLDRSDSEYDIESY